MDDHTNELLEFFPARYPLGLHVVPCGCCEECEQLLRDFSDNGWTTIGAALVEKHYTDLPLFTAEALRYFLPAFLRAAATRPDSNIAEFLLYSLRPSGIRIEELLKYSGSQRNAVVAFLDLMAEKNEYNRDKIWTKARARWLPC